MAIKPDVYSMSKKDENSKPAPGFYVPGRLFSLRSRKKDDLITEIKIAGKALTIGIIGGLPLAIVTLLLLLAADIITFAFNFSVPSYAEIFNIGLTVGVGFLLLLSTVLVIPVAWRKFSDPKTLSRLAYVGLGNVAVAVGLLMPDIFTAWWATWWVGGILTTSWWTWHERWRGSGVAPSPLAGVLRPELSSGQVWFASIHGKRETKVRPVIVLGSGPRKGTWSVSYFTSQEPKTEHLASLYLHVPNGTLRGVSRDNWASISDLRTLTRGDFRTYTGIAPTALYRQICEGYGLTPDPSAHTVDETKAGTKPAPTHLAVLSALGLRKKPKPSKDNSRYSQVNATTQSWKTTMALLNLPIESRKDRRERSKKQFESSKKKNDSD